MNAQTYNVVSDVPLVGLADLRSKHPFGSMNIGDSFALTERDEVWRVRSAASVFGKRNPPAKFAVRIDDPVKRTRRCWRIA